MIRGCYMCCILRAPVQRPSADGHQQASGSSIIVRHSNWLLLGVRRGISPRENLPSAEGILTIEESIGKYKEVATSPGPVSAQKHEQER